VLIATPSPFPPALRSDVEEVASRTSQGTSMLALGVLSAYLFIAQILLVNLLIVRRRDTTRRDATPPRRAAPRRAARRALRAAPARTPSQSRTRACTHERPCDCHRLTAPARAPSSRGPFAARASPRR
jgi:hypothetical protein